MTQLLTQFQTNQFNQTPARGMIDEKISPNIIYYQLKNPDADQITSAGDLVTLEAGASKMPLVRELDPTATAVGYAGFVVLQRKQNLYGSQYNAMGSIVGVASDGCVMYMMANEAITRGQAVAYNGVAGDNQGKIVVNPTTATAGVIPCGYALDEATAQNQLIRVYIKFN